jgi:hypothetical protein
MPTLQDTYLLADAREDRLPKWAQDTIHALRRRVVEEQRRANQSREAGGPEDTDTLLDAWDDVPGRLRKGERVRFLVGDPSTVSRRRDWIDVRVSRDGRQPRLQLMGGGSLVVRPSVTNVLEVTVE